MRHTVSELVLDNGSRGLLINIPDASVMVFNFNFRAGEYLVDINKCQVPHLMEHIILGANEYIPKSRDFQAELEKNGAYNNASTGVYDVTYEAECADFEWERVMKLMLIAISKPLFLEDEFRAEFGNVAEEMSARSNNHFRQLGLTMSGEFGLIAKTDAEHLKLMKNITNNDIKNHYKKTHSTKNMRFIISGKFNKTRLGKIKKLLEDMDLSSDGERFSLPDETLIKPAKPIYIKNQTVKNLYFYLDTFSVNRLNNREYDSLSIVNTLLTETLYSKILGTARELGLVYSMSSGISHTKDFSNWWFGAQVSSKNSLALMDIITEQINNLKIGKISGSDIRATKQYALGRFQRSAQTVAGTTAGYMSRYFFDDVIESYHEIPERIGKISKSDIVKTTNKMFRDKIWGVGILGDCGHEFVDELNNKLAVYGYSKMEDLKNRIINLENLVSQAMAQLKITDLSEQLNVLIQESKQDIFWQNNEQASSIMKKIADLEEQTKPWLLLQTDIKDAIDMLELNDQSLQSEMMSNVEKLIDRFEVLKQDLKFSGPYDQYDVIFSIYAGAGGTDAQDWVGMLLRMYSRFFENKLFDFKILDQMLGDEAGIKSVTLEVNGKSAYGLLKSENGVHRLVRLSPFNANNLRQTSFARVEVMPKIIISKDLDIKESDLKIDVYRSGGHGGQSVNTTDSAVRVTHLPTNISVAIQNERSQLQNKELALTILRSKLLKLKMDQHADTLANLKGPVPSAEWGNQIRSYVLHPYKQVKDIRTKYETSDVDQVLAGAIEPFIDSYLNNYLFNN